MIALYHFDERGTTGAKHLTPPAFLDRRNRSFRIQFAPPVRNLENRQAQKIRLANWRSGKTIKKRPALVAGQNPNVQFLFAKKFASVSGRRCASFPPDHPGKTNWYFHEK